MKNVGTVNCGPCLLFNFPTTMHFLDNMAIQYMSESVLQVPAQIASCFMAISFFDTPITNSFWM